MYNYFIDYYSIYTISVLGVRKTFKFALLK